MADEKLSGPLIIFDGACGFCCRVVERWRQSTGDRIRYVPYQELADPFAGESHNKFAKSVHLILPSGRIYTGAHAVFLALSLGARKRLPLWLYRNIPGVAAIAEFGYRRVANNRTVVSKLTARFW